MTFTLKGAALALALALSTPAWPAMQALPDTSPAAIRQQVQPGDRVRIAVRDGRSFELRVTRVEAESLTGTADTGKSYRIRYGAIERLERDSGVVEVMPAPRDSTQKTWLGLNVGLLAGSVDIPCGAGSSSGDCDEAGVFASYGLNFTVAGEVALRLRAVRAEENTARKPTEIAALVGPQINEGVYVLLGFGKIRNPDDEYDGDSNGLAWELLFAPPSSSGVSFEASVHGNHFGDAEYGGLSIGFRFGKLGRQP